MDCGLFGVRFLFLGYKNGAAAPVDYSSTFATAPYFLWIDISESFKNVSLSISFFSNVNTEWFF